MAAQTLKRLVQLAVPRVACFPLIDLVRDGGWMERVAFRHIDPAREPLLDRSERFRPAEAGLLPIGQVPRGWYGTHDRGGRERLDG